MVHSIFEYNHYCRVPVGADAGASHVASPMASLFNFWLFALVFESLVQSGLWPIFGKTETETGL